MKQNLKIRTTSKYETLLTTQTIFKIRNKNDMINENTINYRT